MNKSRIKSGTGNAFKLLICNLSILQHRNENKKGLRISYNSFVLTVNWRVWLSAIRRKHIPYVDPDC
jgi:hypothetical protein